jgi:anion-transporting  ArsA/GET3 family ATPase
MSALLENLAKQKIILVCGTGGVGKTSVSAALALRLARKGKRVGLVTIDPAKRLAAALGLENLASDPRLIDEVFSKRAGIGPIKGTLSALMYDPKDTLERFVESTGGRELLDKMKANNVYNIIASSFSGTHEYLALTKLHELTTKFDFDTIILDTPPARHTLDFLDAPERLATFFDDAVFQWFLPNPQSKSFLERLRARGTRGAFSVLEKVTGAGVLSDFLKIAPHLHDLKGQFLKRQSEIQALLRGQNAGVLYVSTGIAIAGREFSVFIRDTKQHHLQTLGVVLNRSYERLVDGGLSDIDFSTVPEPVRRNLDLIQSLYQVEKKNAASLGSGKRFPFVSLPELGQTRDPLDAIVELSDGI